MRLTQKQVEEHLITLRMHCDPQSPFQGMIDFQEGLLTLPISQQKQVYAAMPDDLRAMIEAR